MDYVIIGAGLTGLHIAQSLHSQNKNYVILEKSKGLGGRVATRRIDDLGLDHGANYLDEAINNMPFPLKSSEHGHYVTGGMNQIAKFMAQNLNIQKEQKLSVIKKSQAGWMLETEEGLKLETKHIIITAPVPQALELLEKNDLAPSKDHELYSIHYTKALIFLAILNSCDEMKSMSFENHSFHLMKERNLHPKGLVIQCSADFSEQYFDRPEATTVAAILDFMKRSPFGPLQIEKHELKKWRYSRPLKTYSQNFIELHPHLFLCADGFGLPLESAQALINRLL